jgi:hypothetical protein
MSRLFAAARYGAVAVAALAAALAAGCGGPSQGAAGPTPGTPATSSPSPTATQSAPPPPPGQATATRTTAAAAAWPTPEDCVGYDPSAVTVRYEAGIYSVEDSSTIVMRVHGAPGDGTGDKALALARHYRKHCYLGRHNTREDHNAYVFDYWRNPSGMTPEIPGREDDCSSYDRGNLTVEDMGDGYGWRVKDHDHVLQLFDNGPDARHGKLVLSKYRQICFIGGFENENPDVVSYLL